MSRYIYTLLLGMGCMQFSAAQQPGIDKFKVLDLFQNQQFDEAIHYLKADLGNDSGNLQRLGFLGYAYYMSEDYPTAEAYYQKMFSTDSSNITANQYLFTLNESEHPGIARGYGLRLITLEPGKAVHYRLLADLLRKNNARDSALGYYNQAYGLGSGDAKNALGLADMLIEMKQYWRADSIVEAGLGRDSVSIPYLKMRLKSAYEANDYTTALIPGEKLLQLGEISLKPLTQLTLAYYNLKRYPDCIRVCEILAANELNSEAVCYYEAMAYAKLKNFVRSNELLEICLNMTRSQTAEMYYYTLGQNHESLKNYKKAVSYYDTAFYLYKDPLMTYNAGIITETQLGNHRAANQYFLKYLASAKPKNADEQKAYEYVRARFKKTDSTKKSLPR